VLGAIGGIKELLKSGNAGASEGSSRPTGALGSGPKP
jgi:hypothetical protein